ncbi:uncharacterized protein LOC141528050 [Cotesia typhae]|uniref:uncharacterized protein LOC141528050 n=1 Tax=Cotesia typhae TaxID=2053667 RepID=UPI003D69E92E
MDPLKFHFDNRSGTRKRWDELSNDRKRKMRKVYFYHLHYNQDCGVNSSIKIDLKSNEPSDSLLENNYESINDIIIDSVTENSNIIHNQLDVPNTDKTIGEILFDNISIDESVSKSIHNIESNDNIADNIEQTNKTELSSNLEQNETMNVNNLTENMPFADKLQLNLAKCIIDHNINQAQSNAILNVLRAHPLLQLLPKDSRSLLKTPRKKIDTITIAPGEYLHLGLEKMLQSILHRVPLESIPSELLIDFSTDGAELNKETQLWPIQFRVVNLEYSKPELVGMYKGPSKPNSFIDFFSNFVKEVNLIDKNGGIKYNETKIPIKLRCFIADAPARAYVLSHYGHNTEYPCSKCHVKGITYLNSKRFPGINFKLRTNDKYGLLNDVDHHKGKSALHDLSIDLVNSVSFDYMHLVCLGVVKKTIEAIVSRTCLPKKLESFKLNILNNRFITLQLYCPREFARSPRELDHISKFKATEFRQLLLYTFIVVFRGVICDNQYNLFLLLHSSMRVLLNNSSENVYGLKYLTYNAHGLLHLVSDYKLYGPLDSVSAFPYENSMPKYRDFVRKPEKPLQQIFHRI